jgi:hypothetical protein
MDKINQLTPTLVLIIGSMINHVYEKQKLLTIRDFMLILSPTIPTIIPIIISLIISLLNFMCKFAYFEKIVSIFTFLSPFFKKIHLSESININNKENQNKNQHQQKNNPIEENNNKPCTIITIEPNLSFVQTLIKYIITNKETCSYLLENNKNIKIENNESMIETEIWSNIKILFGTINISINPIEIKFIQTGIDIIINEYSIFSDMKNKIKNHKNNTRLTDFMEDCELKTIIKNKINEEISNIQQILTDYPEKSIEKIIASNVLAIYPNLNIALFIGELMLLNEIYSMINSNTLINNIIKNSEKTKKIKLFNYEINIKNLLYGLTYCPQMAQYIF